MKKLGAYLVIPVFALLWLVILRFMPINKDKMTESIHNFGDTVTLKSASLKGNLSFEEVLAKRRSVRSYANQALHLKHVSQLLWAAYGITSGDGLRTAPSAGALYPIKIHVAINNVTGIDNGIYEYLPKIHQLVKRKKGDFKTEIYYSGYEQSMFLDAAIVLIYAVNYKKVVARYGNRGVRFADMDVAHSAQNVYLQAEALNLGTCAVGAFEEDKMQNIIGCDSNYKVIYLLPVGMKKTKN